MAIEHTQAQSPADELRSKQLSLERSAPPTDVPGYEAQRLLGVGAYGEVWVGVDKNTGRRVAIKFYAHRRGVDWSLLSREVEKLVFLSADRYVVQLLDVGWSADPPYYVMEYVERGSLEDFLRSHGPLPATEAVELFREIAVGLSHAHGKGVLHCDLKPANILLDDDRRPRLADFGQSRMTTEQRPALGTLFYMAPEQADLDAVPDVRWDVYALGAILYCLLLGEPPHRNDESISQLETAPDLADRLARYRQVIRTSPLPTEHRRLRGVDKALADVVEHCLAPSPRDRFANVQEVLDALAARQTARTRRPLVMLGLAGPLLLCAVMAVFGFWTYEQVRNRAETMARDQALENNQATAQLAAEKVHNEIRRYFSIVEREAERPEVRDGFQKLATSKSLARLNEPTMSEDERPKQVEQFLSNEQRQELNAHLENRLKAFVKQALRDPQAPKFASLLVLDKNGTMLAAAYDVSETITQSIGGNWAFRSYFHGGPADLPRNVRPPEVEPTERTVLSAVFQSTSTNRWKVAITTPILEDPGNPNTLLGVLTFTINLGDFAFFRTANRSPDRFAVLVDGRGGEAQGKVLQHPLFNDLLRALPDRMTERRIPLQSDGTLASPDYEDPFQDEPEAVGLDREWLAATARVPSFSDGGEGEDAPRDSGLVVLVQEDAERIVAPVKNISQAVLQLGAGAIAVVAAISATMWLLAVGPLRPTRTPPTVAPFSNGDSTPLPQSLTQTATAKRENE